MFFKQCLRVFLICLQIVLINQVKISFKCQCSLCIAVMSSQPRNFFLLTGTLSYWFNWESNVEKEQTGNCTSGQQMTFIFHFCLTSRPFDPFFKNKQVVIVLLINIPCSFVFMLSYSRKYKTLSCHCSLFLGSWIGNKVSKLDMINFFCIENCTNKGGNAAAIIFCF